LDKLFAGAPSYFVTGHGSVCLISKGCMLKSQPDHTNARTLP